MEYCFCTVITKDYLPLAKTLFESLTRFMNIDFYCLISSDKPEDIHTLDNFYILWIGDLKKDDFYTEVRNKYIGKDMDAFRYAMKPVLIHWLLLHKNYYKVVFLDPDLYFYSSPQEILDLLDQYHILLTPHWINPEPSNENKDFDKLFYDGLYNAGFVAFNKKAIDAVVWWTNACIFRCSKDSKSYNTYVDQTYLNLFPVYFKKVKLLNRGYNLAGWNFKGFDLIENGNGDYLVNNLYPLVFIHFSPYTIHHFLNNRRKIYIDLTREYLNELARNGQDIQSAFFKKRNINWYIGQLLPKRFINRISSKKVARQKSGI